MEIKAIKTFPYDFGWKECLFVKVETDEGISGWGEAGIVGRERACEATIREIEPYLVGKDPGQIELHWNTLYRDSHWRPSYTFLGALAGIEMAMWDILGKQLNVPVYRLLGGLCNRQIMVYDDSWYSPSDFRIKTLEDYGELAQRAVAQGFKHLKWDPWWDTGSDIFIDPKDMKRAKECVKIVREAVGDDVELLIEMHGRFNQDNAIRIARDLEEFRPYWIEEPIPPNCSVDALAKVSSSTQIPVAAGERILTRWGFWEVFQKQAISFAQPDIIHCGGILETKKIAAMAQVFYVGVAPHINQGPIEVAATMHLNASTPNFVIQEFCPSDVPAYEEIIGDTFLIPQNGFIEIEDRPGLGIEVNEKALTKKPFEHGRRQQLMSGLY